MSESPDFSFYTPCEMKPVVSVFMILSFIYLFQNIPTQAKMYITTQLGIIGKRTENGYLWILNYFLYILVLCEPFAVNEVA
uniref:Uncharacterized protein n=1 Tax=Pyxicephalus adspersus TaxID=30357 RepID=A0AAV2ZUK0_PYXAD|nr:TPA: hypothetical protein GDO54_013189 [Pyxicephalus adspersus]